MTRGFDLDKWLMQTEVDEEKSDPRNGILDAHDEEDE